MAKLFVSGIDTGIGKTIASAILVKALKADYWKPVQSGDLDKSDSQSVRKLVGDDKLKIFPERFRLNTPASPHLSARLDGVNIKLDDFELPDTKNPLVVEGAGGLMVPLNDKDLIIDLVKKLQLDLVLVVKNYLGSINHSLLSLEMAKKRGIKVKGIIVNGEKNSESEMYISHYSDVPIIGRIPQMDDLSPAAIEGLANHMKASLPWT